MDAVCACLVDRLNPDKPALSLTRVSSLRTIQTLLKKPSPTGSLTPSVSSLIRECSPLFIQAFQDKVLDKMVNVAINHDFEGDDEARQIVGCILNDLTEDGA